MSSDPRTERLVFCCSTHWVKYARVTLLCGFLAAMGILLLYTATIAALSAVSMITFGIGTALVLYSHHRFFHKLMSESMYDIFVTTERIIYFDDTLFLANDEHEIPLHRIAGIEARQRGLQQNMLNYGTLWIDTGGSAVDLKRSIPNVPQPDDLSETIARLVHTQRDHA